MFILKEKRQKRQPIIYKTLHRKQKIEQHERHKKRKNNNNEIGTLVHGQNKANGLHLPKENRTCEHV
jgi:hypothetical protein